MEATETLISTVSKTLACAWLNASNFSVTQEQATKPTFCVGFTSADSAIIIGSHGKNLDAFCHLFTRMAERALGYEIRIHLEVNDYLKHKDERLIHLAQKKIAIVQKTHKSEVLENLNAYERKKIHDYVHENLPEGITTRSEGDKTDRKLYIEYIGNPTITPLLTEDGTGI